MVNTELTLASPSPAPIPATPTARPAVGYGRIAAIDVLQGEVEPALMALQRGRAIIVRLTAASPDIATFPARSGQVRHRDREARRLTRKSFPARRQQPPEKHFLPLPACRPLSGLRPLCGGHGFPP
jgi:hypothetical protein